MHHLALTMLPHIGDIQIGILLQHLPDPVAIFRSSTKTLESIPGIGTVRARSIKGFADFKAAERELRFAHDNGIQVLVKGEAGYPCRLSQCIDAPHVLFYKGTADIDQERILSVIGTRSPTHYGRGCVEELMEALTNLDVLVVSGLAYGIDTLAHKACVQRGMETIGVLGHGHDRIYPVSNRALAEEMVVHGGLLTEFRMGTRPERQHFPLRNRIVAGMADAVVVIESGEKGGSLITAGLANSYNKEVLAYPGRAIDPMSMGCNRLIRQQQAAMVCNGAQVLEYMNWTPKQVSNKIIQKKRWPQLTDDEQRILALLREQGRLHVDQLSSHAQLSPAVLSGVLIMLEMEGYIRGLPGKVYAPVGQGVDF